MRSANGTRVCATRLRHGRSQRIARVEAGLLGDVKFFGGIGELRVDYGPGYRVYFAQRGPVLVILLCGGDKSSQDRDIETAKTMAKEL